MTQTHLTCHEKRQLDDSLSNAHENKNIKKVHEIISQCSDPIYALHTSVSWASYYGNIEYLNEVFSSNKINVSWMNDQRYGQSFLHPFALNGHTDVVSFLISKGVNINQVDTYGNTPIHIAASIGRDDVVKVLIEGGANLFIKNMDGYTPIDEEIRFNKQNSILQRAMSKQKEHMKVKPSENISSVVQVDAVEKSMKQDQTTEEKKELLLRIEKEKKTLQQVSEKSKLMEKQKELLDTEKKQLSSLLEKQKKRTEQLETDNKELLSQIEKEKETLQEVSEKSELMKKQNETLEKEKNQSLSDLKKQMNRTDQLKTEKKEMLFQIQEEKKTLYKVLEKNEVMKKQNQALETEKNDSLFLLEKQRKELQQLETEKQELVCLLERERKTVQEMTELMKHNQTMETDSHSHLEKQREQLETEKKELQFQLDEERKELQRVLGKCDMMNERNITLETELNKQQKISGKSEMIEEQNEKLEDEKKALQSQLEKQMQKLQELSDKCISTEGESRKVINEVGERKQQLEIEKNELLTSLEEKQKEIQRLTDKNSGLARQLEGEKVELPFQLEEQTMKSNESPGISFNDLLEKPPETKDILGLVKDISSLWNELGAELDVLLNDRTTLRGDKGLTDRDRLESVVTNWIGNETKEVKWKVILEALKALKRKDLIRKVIQYLETPEIHRRYISMDDFSPCPF